jgi:glycosyltransferase involved in cell wall biosynthesis
MSYPLVSVVMTVFNGEKFLSKSINSIINQSYKNWELIIVNDNSQDSTNKILNKYQSKNIKIINLKKNIGAFKATNLAFKKVKGKYTAILDADDYSHPKRISGQVIELEKNSDIGLVITKYKLVDENNNFIKKSRHFSQKDFNKRFPCENLACNSSAMFRSKFIQELKFYDKFFFYMYDYNFYLKIFKISKVKIINKFYTFYRVHKNQRTQTLKKNIIFKENLLILLWSMKNLLINFNNAALFFKRFFINFIKYFFAITIKYNI